MHTDITAVSIQSKKIALNEVKDNKALLEFMWKKPTLTSGPTQ